MARHLACLRRCAASITASRTCHGFPLPGPIFPEVASGLGVPQIRTADSGYATHIAAAHSSSWAPHLTSTASPSRAPSQAPSPKEGKSHILDLSFSRVSHATVNVPDALPSGAAAEGGPHTSRAQEHEVPFQDSRRSRPTSLGSILSNSLTAVSRQPTGSSAQPLQTSSWNGGCHAHFAGSAQHSMVRFSSAAAAQEAELTSTSSVQTPAAPPFAFLAEPREPQPGSRRTGVIAIKCGMTGTWDKWGRRIPVTVLWVNDNQVVQVKTAVKEGYNALQVGCGQKKAKQLTKPELGHFAAAGVPLKRKLAEFRVSEDAMLPVGTPLDVRHFMPGQFVDVVGITTGKGFQGGMKRWGFKGGPASHGASLSHRSLGSTGGRQDPGKVFKGKKMPGQMGAERRTVENIWVYKIEPARGLMWVRGQVPGHDGNFVLVRDSHRKRTPDLPFPTFFPELDEDLDSLIPIVADLGDGDPFMKE